MSPEQLAAGRQNRRNAMTIPSGPVERIVGLRHEELSRKIGELVAKRKSISDDNAGLTPEIRRDAKRRRLH